MAASASPPPDHAARRSPGVSSLISKAIRARRIRAVLSVIGVATSTLLVLVLLAVFRNPVESVSDYLAQPGLDAWVMPSGTDNLVRTAGFLPMSIVNGIREIEGVERADPLVRVFVRVTSRASRAAHERSRMLLALGYRVPDGLGGPAEFDRGRPPHGALEVALDRAAAYRLGVGLGDTVRVNDRPCRVVGLTRKSNVLVTQFLFFDFEVAENTSGLSDQTSFVVARAKPGMAADVIRRIADEFRGTEVLSGPAFLDNSVRESASGFVPVLTLIAILGVLASALLVALLVQGLMEDRRSDIAVLGAMGAGILRIGVAMIVHAFALVAAGTLLGAIAARGLEAVLDRLVPTVQLAFATRDVVLTLAAFAVAGVLGALAPVMRLRAVDPLEAFRT
jgi:putative ABC transport system permease protein